ncbi:MAG: TolC family protein [Lentisphaeria bacterium]|jgi:outer membrane protein TolC|nr:TolC family protein [Lentisphaeria bacterium]
MLPALKPGLVFLLLLVFCLRLGADELESLLLLAERNSPSLQAARQRVEQTLLRHEELMEFFDPALFAAAGRATDYRALPLQSNYSVLGSNSFEVQGGVEVPIEPGAYVSVGAASRLLYEPVGYDRLYQNLFGVRVRVPLLRDRRFSLFGYRRQVALAEYNQRVSELLASSQELRHQVELAYVSVYERLSSYHIAQEASKRFESLVKVARELTGLKAIPDYEVHSTERELQIGLDDQEQAKNRHELSLLELTTLIGGGSKPELRGEIQTIINLGEQKYSLPRLSAERAFQNRGDLLSIEHQIQRVRAQYDSAEEQMKDEVYLHAGASMQSENTDHPFERHRKLGRDYLAGEITLVWSRPLDYYGGKKRLAVFESEIAELKAELARKELLVRQEMQNAELNFLSAQRRLGLISSGLRAAQATLEAEQERFRLGEGSSTDVLDAQKNLTVMLQRLTLAAADRQRAKCDYYYACGYETEENKP